LEEKTISEPAIIQVPSGKCKEVGFILDTYRTKTKRKIGK
jgi:hypothetical protein